MVFRPAVLSYDDIRKLAEQFLVEFHDERTLPVPTGGSRTAFQFTTDQNAIYLLAVENAFGWRKWTTRCRTRFAGAIPGPAEAFPTNLSWDHEAASDGQPR